jgi:hypothetical protein
MLLELTDKTLFFLPSHQLAVVLVLLMNLVRMVAPVAAVVLVLQVERVVLGLQIKEEMVAQDLVLEYSLNALEVVEEEPSL